MPARDDRPVRAVVFDLYDTVVFVDPVRRERHQEELARQLGMTTRAFLSHWQATSAASNRGEIGPTEDRFREVMARAGVAHADPARLAEAEHAFLRTAATPIAGMDTLLAELRSAGIRLGLLSNCSASATHTLEAACPVDAFDAVALSCEAGLVKPDPRFFLRLCDRLGVEPSATLYIADGVGGELEAADDLGMRTVRAAYANRDGTAPSTTMTAPSVDALARILNSLPG
ncbi:MULTISPECIES: HAD-IA family hydrolase [unclassified Leifsonia]|uniref:HAD family hydrolase n=1 Tax=unclassified Leifsonia TaxID=2663824 RepID=UPI0008A7219E|nr:MULTISPECIES: HAD-IA family hydrolase [unclassified Leifsonia]SEH54532.1 putative hydrolase of the HAD superfamily [Leifsonia sp. CL154]SFL24516.1 putative hydrolase of the HAD superfamily [Leifsonia sp. CL147]